MRGRDGERDPDDENAQRDGEPSATPFDDGSSDAEPLAAIVPGALCGRGGAIGDRLGGGRDRARPADDGSSDAEPLAAIVPGALCGRGGAIGDRLGGGRDRRRGPGRGDGGRLSQLRTFGGRLTHVRDLGGRLTHIRNRSALGVAQAVVAQRGQVLSSGGVATLMCARKRLLSFAQPVVFNHEPGNLECTVSIAALIGAEVCRRGPIGIAQLLQQDAKLGGGVRVPALVRDR
jgi:hypothetical protein